MEGTPEKGVVGGRGGLGECKQDDKRNDVADRQRARNLVKAPAENQACGDAFLVAVRLSEHPLLSPGQGTRASTGQTMEKEGRGKGTLESWIRNAGVSAYCRRPGKAIPQ